MTGSICVLLPMYTPVLVTLGCFNKNKESWEAQDQGTEDRINI
jgi:hypothetical protein